jgi:hypothetical protein
MAATRTRKCTRCQDSNGVPTGIVLGGECFQCRGAGNVTREVVTADAKAAGRRRAQAVATLRAATAALPNRTRCTLMDSRSHLEETAPERHARLVESVLAGRTDAVIAALTAYATQMGF